MNIKRYFSLKFNSRLVPLTIVLLLLLLRFQKNNKNPEANCLSKIWTLERISANPTKPVLEIEIFTDDKNVLRVSVNNLYNLILTDGKKELSWTPATQYEYGKIRDLILSKNRWFWINGDETDYIGSINMNKIPPEIELKVLPDLYSKPCSYLSKFFGNCLNAYSYYSYEQDSVFITGYKPSFLGNSHLLTFQVTLEKTQLLDNICQQFYKNTL